MSLNALFRNYNRDSKTKSVEGEKKKIELEEGEVLSFCPRQQTAPNLFRSLNRYPSCFKFKIWVLLRQAQFFVECLCVDLSF